MTQAHPTSSATADPDCPVSLDLLGRIYRADHDDLPEILERIAPPTRARLAAYLYGKSHMHHLGLKVARACEREELVRAAGEIGSVIHGQAQFRSGRSPEGPSAPARKISLGGSAARDRTFGRGLD